ncbi:hypothetical protein B9Z49_05815 [Limnohabitans sp. 2KL-51]|nr:hypothetical protein B9Z49_05815 [Limnohabitans sp. 2KL-51]
MRKKSFINIIHFGIHILLSKKMILLLKKELQCKFIVSFWLLAGFQKHILLSVRNMVIINMILEFLRKARYLFWGRRGIWFLCFSGMIF